MEKHELYNAIVSLQKETGQGLTGIVKLKDSRIGPILDDLVKEGRLIKNDIGGSFGPPELNEFYTPSKGYNVWADKDAGGNALNFVRMYVGALENESSSSEGINDFVNPTVYTEWLTKNKEELDIMMSLEEMIPENQ